MATSKCFIAAPVILLFLQFYCVYPMIFQFTNTKVSEGTWEIQRQTMYSRNDTPIGSAESYLETRLNISANMRGFATILLYNYETRNAYGQGTSPKIFCCTDELSARGQCTLGEVIIRNTSGITPPLGVRKVIFSISQPVVTFNFKATLSKTSTYYLTIANCKGSEASDLLINGQVIWKNPYGYLPGSALGLWYYYGLQSLAYLFLSIAFGVLMYLYRNQLLRIQYGIVGLMILGMLQLFCWYVYELQRNKSGLQSSGTGALVMAIFFTVVKGTVTRLVVLAVCMGIGIIKWTLGSTKIPVFALSGAYFVTSLLYEVVETYKQLSTTDLNTLLTSLVVFGVWICDTIFVWWALVSIIRTMGQLTLRRQAIKLAMYRRFFYVMVGCVAIWALSLLIHFFVLATHETDQIWKSNWVWLAFWHFSFFVILCIIGFLWRPTKNNTRYGYSEVYYDDEEEGELHNQPATNEVQLHSMGTSAQMGETKTRSNKVEDEMPSSSDSSSTLTISSKFDMSNEFSMDDDDKPTVHIRKRD